MVCRVLLVGAATAMFLSACSSDGGVSATHPDALSGRIAGTAGAVTRVCADTNANFRCDNGEASGKPASDGSFAVRVPAATLDANPVLLLVAEVAGDTAVALATPASGSRYVSALTTLVSIRMVEAAVPQAEAHAQVIRELRLPDSVDLFDATAGSRQPGLQRIEEMTVAALNAGAAAYAGTTNATPGSATVHVARAALTTIARYVDPNSGQLYPGVTEKTVTGESAAAFAPASCDITAPPVMRITTENAAPIVSKDSYVQAQVAIESTAAFPTRVNASTRIRGRGNSTWGMPKKPYRLNLQQSQPLLKMASEKDWALLANYSDKTMLRNAVAMCMGKMLGMRYTPSAHPVEVTLNGSYDGMYWLTEHIKASDVRVNLGSASGSAADAGFLLEIDYRLDEDFWFYSEQGLPYTIKSDATEQVKTTIESQINEMERVLFGDSFADPERGYLRYLDVESLIDFYLINELMRNNDAFLSSTFVYRPRGGKLVFGPLWDFDIAAGNIDYDGNWATEGWHVRNSVYMNRLLSDEVLRRHVAARWQFLKENLPRVQRFIDASEVVLDAAQRRNFQRWDILGTYVWPNWVVTGSYAGEVDYLQQWLADRAAWMDGEISGG